MSKAKDEARQEIIPPGFDISRKSRVKLVTTRLSSDLSKPGPFLSGPECAGEFLSKLIGNRDREYGVVLLLDGSHNVAAIDIVSVGTLNATQVHAREVFKAAILANARAIIFGHNHPSGNLEPSRPDLDVTHRLAEAGRLLDIPLLDSLIVSQNDYRQVDPELSTKLQVFAPPRDLNDAPREDTSSEVERRLFASASSVLHWLADTRRLAGLSPEELRAEAESLQSDLAVHLKAANGSSRASPESSVPLDESREALAESIDALLSGSALERIGSALHAGSLLVQAYDLGRSAGGSIEWSDLDAAFVAACDSLGLEPELDSSFDETLDPEELDREEREVLRDMLLEGELDPDL